MSSGWFVPTAIISISENFFEALSTKALPKAHWSELKIIKAWRTGLYEADLEAELNHFNIGILTEYIILDLLGREERLKRFRKIGLRFQISCCHLPSQVFEESVLVSSKCELLVVFVREDPRGVAFVCWEGVEHEILHSDSLIHRRCIW